MRNALTFEWVLEPQGLTHARTLYLDGGRIDSIEDAGDRPRDGFLALPGMANAHSHVFQRALRGAADSGGLDSFWSWRETMYRLAAALTPEDLHLVASSAFAEMLEAGYTSVGEFHYLHHLPDGSRSPAMAEALIAAATDSGIRLRLLPVYYRHGGFGRPASPAQSRFVHRDLADFERTVEPVAAACAGLAPHSLRAVTPDEIAAVVALADRMFGPQAPLHIHVSEQAAEVRDCVALHGRPPILLLDERVGLGSRWNLVHATHAGRLELDCMLAGDAIVVLCPLTEGQLGDGWFPADEFLARGGRIAIGSDSNVRIDVLEEMRFLEFSQRARLERRNVLTGPAGTGARIWSELARAGAASLGLVGGELAPGQVADVVVVPESATLAGLPVTAALDALLVAAGRGEPFDVYVDGELRVRRGRALATSTRERVGALLSRLWRSP
jgi:formimidoylglutamate deiminase